MDGCKQIVALQISVECIARWIKKLFGFGCFFFVKWLIWEIWLRRDWKWRFVSKCYCSLKIMVVMPTYFVLHQPCDKKTSQTICLNRNNFLYLLNIPPRICSLSLMFFSLTIEIIECVIYLLEINQIHQMMQSSITRHKLIDWLWHGHFGLLWCQLSNQ